MLSARSSNTWLNFNSVFLSNTGRVDPWSALTNFSSRFHEPELIYTLFYTRRTNCYQLIIISVKYVKITRVVSSSNIFLGTQCSCLKPSSFTQEEMKTTDKPTRLYCKEEKLTHLGNYVLNTRKSSRPCSDRIFWKYERSVSVVFSML